MTHVSAVICTRNRPDLIGNAVASVLANTYPSFDLLVVDQSDDDRTGAVVRELAVLAGTGLVLGSGVTAGAAAVIGQGWLGVTPTDPQTYTAVAIVLAIAALAAAILPAARAGRVNVSEALRHE